MLRLFSRKKRPFHFGKYPMEKIKRVDKTTTLITDNIPRIPHRANFFIRANFGDLGKKPQQELRRFVSKYPISRSMGKVANALIPLHQGETNEEKAPIPEDPQELANHIKSLCYFLEADMVGICELPEWAWFTHDFHGNPVEAKHKYAIVMLIDQGQKTMAAASGDDWISGAQSYIAYTKGSVIGVTVADYIRQLGYDADPHTNDRSHVNHIPLTLLAGLGELSRIGEVVLNPFMGPRFKTTVVTTDLPLAVDKPIDFGLQDFCSKCLKCARECPPGAISFGDKVMFNGYEMWKPDVESCTRYRIMNPGGSSCGRCLKVCPFNKEDGVLSYRWALWLAINVPATRKFLSRADDWFGFGERVKAWKWWYDLEWKDGRLIQARKTNQRNLRPERQKPERQNITFYDFDSLPPPDSHEPHPVRRTSKKSS